MEKKLNYVFWVLALIIMIGLVVGLLVYVDYKTSFICENTDTIQPSTPPPVVTKPDKKELHDDLSLSSPLPDETIASPLKVFGQARGTWYFEAVFSLRLEDALGKTITQGLAQAQSDWMTEEFVPFKAELTFEQPDTDTGYLVLEKDNPSGLPEHAAHVKIPVKFEQKDQMTVKVFFSNSQYDPNALDCSQTHPVTRKIDPTQAVATASLAELLKGPSYDEKAKGFYTSINEGVRVNSLSIENGVAKVDFSAELQNQVGGSCRVAAIYSQIENTLRQFNSVDKVQISVDGETEEILQP